MKKIIVSSVLAGLMAVAALADSTAWNIPATTATNLLKGPIRINSLIIVTTNQTTLNVYDFPNNTLTNFTLAYTNYTQYATNIQQIWTNFFGANNTNYLTNCLVTITNSNPAATNFAPLIATFTVGSNTTSTITLSGLFMNGFTVSNTTANAASLTANYSGQ